MADKPSRHWVQGDDGWQSHDRWRCDPDSHCGEILMPPSVYLSDEGKPNPWELREV